MKPTKKEISIQLIKEFWFPILIALLWLGMNVLFTVNNADSKAIKNINIFGTVFFFFSFLTGNYNRVKKQLSVEKNLNSVERNLIELTNQLDRKTTHLINYMTGGDSYFYYQVDLNVAPEDCFKLIVNYNGDYPVNNVMIWFPFRDSNFKDQKVELATINKKSAGRVGCDLKLQFNGTNSYMSSIIFNAGNKSWVQLLYFDKKGQELAVRSEIYIDKNLTLQENYSSQLYDWNGKS